MNTRERWRVPDRVFQFISWLVVIATWGMIWYFYPDLPARIPEHFGPNGLPDGFAAKGFWTVFFPGLIQIFLSLLLTLVYRHPQYANIPFSLTLPFVPEPYREKLSRLIRHIIIMTQLIMNLTFAYIAESMIGVSLKVMPTLNSAVMFSLIGLMLLIIAVYSVWMYRLSKQAQAAMKTPDSLVS